MASQMSLPRQHCPLVEDNIQPYEAYRTAESQEATLKTKAQRTVPHDNIWRSKKCSNQLTANGNMREAKKLTSVMAFASQRAHSQLSNSASSPETP